MNRVKLGISIKKVLPLEIVIGLILVAVSFIVASNIDMEKAEVRLNNTVEYMKNQCNDSQIRDLASEAKSELRLTESVEQVRWRLKYGDEIRQNNGLNTETLNIYSVDSYLDGLILLDSEGNVETSYDSTGMGTERILAMTDISALMDTLSFKEKSYALRVELEDESHVDIAAVSRIDDDGVVVGYFYTSAQYARIINNSIRSIISVYNPETDCVIAISTGNKISISNDKALEGTNVEDTFILKKIMDRGTGTHLTHAKDRSKVFGNHFGLMDKSRDYYIYAYMNERSVFRTTLANVLCAFLIYVLLLIVANMLFWRTEKSYQKSQMLVQENYTRQLEEKNRQLEAEANRADKANMAKRDFLSRMSHDIRTPLNGIIGLLKIDEDHFDDIELVRENHKKMQISANHLLSLINDVLQMSKLEDGNTVLTREVINLADMTKDIVTIIKVRAVEAGVEWDYEKGKSRIPYPYIYGSPVHLRQIFLNVYGNCIKYNHAGGKITTIVDVASEGDGICTYRWIITDTGAGMSKEFLKHIFEPFAQEKNDARSEYQGTGLGMAIVKGLIDQMGGTITVESEKGVGSEFIITIPFEIAEKPAESDADDALEDDIRGLNIMLVEDNELNAEIAKMLLEDQGAEVIIFTDGKQAVDMFTENEQGTFDVILMDIMMPVMDGITAAKAIRSMDRPDAKTIPIIAMTANAFKEDADKCLAAGMNAHLAKPLDIKKLKRVIARQVNGERK